MKRLLFTLLLLVSLGTGRASPNLATPADVFGRAEEAYKAGRWDEAVAQYDGAIKAGTVSPQLFFNRGNANFKKGDLGAAILDYRRAASLAPRDGDIQANLRFALERAGTPSPDESVAVSLVSRITNGEWVLLAAVAYWAAGLLFAHFLWWGHRWARKGAAVAALIGIAALAGLLERSRIDAEPEFVVLTRCQALFAPFEKATPHFELPPGSVVREINRTGDWIEVRAGDQCGWIQIGTGKEVSAWQTGSAT